MLVQWTTKNSSAPEVKWGLQSGKYSDQAAASSMTYTKEDLCGPPANAQGWLDPGTLHKALITSLQAGQRYYYIYGDEVCTLERLLTRLFGTTNIPMQAFVCLTVAVLSTGMLCMHGLHVRYKLQCNVSDGT